MITPRLLLCSGITASDLSFSPNGREIVELNAQGLSANVNIRVEDVAKIFLKHVSPRLVDLLEIGSYVYAADCGTRRGSQWSENDSVEPWTRDFHFVIPVRDPSFWQREEVIDLLVTTLNFLSNDRYKFDFINLTTERPVQEYLQFSKDEDWPFDEVDRVMMFSGGLDSLAGAVTSAHTGGKLVLVSHRSVGSLDKRQRTLFEQLKQTYPNPMLHIPVWINKDAGLGREHTQRTRSFLYSALGTVVAESLRAGGVRFFENGVVSLNLPVADEALRARASRTTHPFTMNLLERLYCLVCEREFVIDNPFLFETKADVVRIIADCQGEHLIQYTCSCAHSMFQSKNQWHCGCCSQCIDRRIAVIAAGQSHNDPELDYVSDVFTGDRKEGYQQNIAVDYVRHAIELHRMDSTEMAAVFNLELARASRIFSDRREAFRKFVDLHKRYGDEVYNVLIQQVKNHANRVVAGDLPERSMLRLIAGSAHRISTWKRFADKVLKILQTGLPIACQSEKPTNEPKLQQICDGILSTHENDLLREFPFMRWSSSSTKPDWSSESFNLWIELKYVRATKDINVITEAIAADITKYGDNKRFVLFVVYDPYHLITKEDMFAEPIRTRETMDVAFIR